jgi:RNA polymerase sigma factor for flagellar operon FliA
MSQGTVKQMDLWRKYRQSKDPSIREKLILEYSNLIKYIAGRLNIYFGSNVEYDDLVGYGGTSPLQHGRRTDPSGSPS